MLSLMLLDTLLQFDQEIDLKSMGLYLYQCLIIEEQVLGILTDLDECFLGDLHTIDDPIGDTKHARIWSTPSSI